MVCLMGTNHVIDKDFIFLTYHLNLSERFYNIILVLALETSEC